VLIVTRFIAAAGLSATRFRPVCSSLTSGWDLASRCIGLSRVDFLILRTHTVALPRCFQSVRVFLASEPDGGLRLVASGSAVTLMFSRLSRRSLFQSGNSEGSTNQWPESESEKIITLDPVTDPA
jgi:hypothetical protein